MLGNLDSVLRTHSLTISQNNHLIRSGKPPCRSVLHTPKALYIIVVTGGSEVIGQPGTYRGLVNVFVSAVADIDKCDILSALSQTTNAAGVTSISRNVGNGVTWRSLVHG